MAEAPAHEKTGVWLASVTIVLTLLGWSSIPLFLKHFAGLIDPWTANGWRYAFSALLWAPMLWWGARNGQLDRGLWKAALIPGIFNALGQICFGVAPYFVDPGLMTFSLRLQIIFVTLGAAIMFPVERKTIRTPLFLAGLAAVFLGTSSTIALKPGGLGSGTTFGIALSIGSGLLYAAYALSVRRTIRGVNPLLAFAVISQYTAAVLVPLMLLLGDRAGATALDLPASQFALLMLSSLIGIGLGHTFYYISIARLGVAVSGGVIQLQPVIVAAASTMMFNEPFTTAQWATGAIAIVGAGAILLAQHSASRRS